MKDLTKNVFSTFKSCEKDCETIFRKILTEDKLNTEELLRLLVINTKDCIDNKTNQAYKNIIEKTNIKTLIDGQYIRTAPKLYMPESEEVKSYILITMDNFTPSENPEFRNCIIHFDVICHTDYWDIGGFRQRPIKIAGCIDGALNNAKLSGIGTLKFLGMNMIILNEELSGYTLSYAAIHSIDDVR